MDVQAAAAAVPAPPAFESSDSERSADVSADSTGAADVAPVHRMSEEEYSAELGLSFTKIAIC
jgi:hypothetical protein